MRNIFDEILSNKIGFGKFQIFSILLISLVDLDDGVQLILIPLITPLIKKEFSLSVVQISTLTSIFYIGMIFGSVLTGKIADIYGRRISLVFSSFLQFIISFSFVFASSYNQMILVRFLYGAIFGFSLPLTTALASEITPLKYRGRSIVVINFFMTIGKLYACLIASFFLIDLNTGDWKKIMMCSSLTPLLVFFLSAIFLDDSARFLCARGKFENAWKIMDKMSLINTDKQLDLSQMEREKIIEWQKTHFHEKESLGFKNLLDNRNRSTSIRLWIVWFSNNFMYYGQLAVNFKIPII